jgi:predicted dehydrogenase
MATTTIDAERMIAADAESQGILSIFQNRRYSPDFVTVRDVLQSGMLGRTVLIHMTASGFGRRWDWQTLREYGGGSLNNNAVHALDQALLLIGDGVPEVFCHMEQTLTLGDAEDHVKLILKTDGAPMIDLEVSSACVYPRQRWHIVATRGGLEGSGSSLRWKYLEVADLPTRRVDRLPTPDRSYNHEEYGWIEQTWDRDDFPGQGEIGYYIDLFEAIRRGAPLAVTPDSVRRVIQVLEECHRQAGI